MQVRFLYMALVNVVKNFYVCHMDIKNTQKVAEHISEWLKNYAVTNKTKGFVIGISGGIDSAVTSTLCAMTGLKVLCVRMPIHQNEDHNVRATEQIEFLKAKFGDTISELTVDLTSTFETFKSTVNENIATVFEEEFNFHLANSRARLRMTTLYFYAGLGGLLVAGTGNKVEDYGIGFFTKYGDGGVDISPIGDLLKSEVYQVAAYLGVPESIQQAAPTDGLFGDTRTDEDQIGATYDELEWAMDAYEGLPFTFPERQEKVLEIYSKRHEANAHKMAMPPVCDLTGIK